MAILAFAGCAQQVPDRAIMVDQSAGSLDEPLTSEPPDPTRGLAVVQGRDGNCLLCHAIPETGARFMGNLGPSLSGVGSRMSAGQLRLRLADSLRLNPNSIMPSYYKSDGL